MKQTQDKSEGIDQQALEKTWYMRKSKIC